MARRTTPAQFIKNFFKEIKRKDLPPDADFYADIFFRTLRQDLINSIVNSDIGQELSNHTTPSKILGTKGSLFGFLGLYAGSDPIQDIIDIINNKMSYKISRRLVRGGVKITVKLPDLKDFRTDSLILPWEGGYSAVDAIEKGVSGFKGSLKKYIQSESSRSISGEGLQVKRVVRGSVYKPRPWLSKFFDEIREKSKEFRGKAPI